ncbi:putative H/ACA ribonucleoprotein complex subunit 2-like protein, partial [Trichinella nelsoni]
LAMGKEKKNIREETVGVSETEISVPAIDFDDTNDSKSFSAEDSSSLSNRESYAHACTLVNEIAQPLASRKLAKKIFKLLDKARKFKREGVLTGIDQVQKAIRKGKIGICVLAGDVSPIDYYSHIPIVCEEKNLAYIFLPSKNHIGAAMQSNRPIMIAYILCCESYKDLYNEVHKIIEALPMPNDMHNGKSQKNRIQFFTECITLCIIVVFLRYWRDCLQKCRTFLCKFPIHLVAFFQ